MALLLSGTIIKKELINICGKMSERKLAHIEVIESLSPIPGADKIEVAQVLGW